MKIKVAVFTNSHEGHHVFETYEDGSCWADEFGNYIRLTDAIEVEFPDRNPENVLKDHLKHIDDKEAELRANFQMKLNELEAWRSNLLSLPAEVKDGNAA